MTMEGYSVTTLNSREIGHAETIETFFPFHLSRLSVYKFFLFLKKKRYKRGRGNAHTDLSQVP